MFVRSIKWKREFLWQVSYEYTWMTEDSVRTEKMVTSNISLEENTAFSVIQQIGVIWKSHVIHKSFSPDIQLFSTVTCLQNNFLWYTFLLYEKSQILLWSLSSCIFNIHQWYWGSSLYSLRMILSFFDFLLKLHLMPLHTVATRW